jgi:hypothetical protein
VNVFFSRQNCPRKKRIRHSLPQAKAVTDLHWGVREVKPYRRVDGGQTLLWFAEATGRAEKA